MEINVSDPQQMLWALATRCNPDAQIDIMGTRGSVMDPILHPDKKKRGGLGFSTAIVVACRPPP